MLRAILAGGGLLVAGAVAWGAPKGTVAVEGIAAWRVRTGTPAAVAARDGSSRDKLGVEAEAIWAVQLGEGDLVALAGRVGAEVVGPLGGLQGWFLWRFTGTDTDAALARAVAAKLDAEPLVLAYEQQFRTPGRAGVAVAPPSFPDARFNRQFHLINDGQDGGTRGQDANLMPAWALGFTGSGVVVGVVDDGIDGTHPDLAPNVRADLAVDVVDGDSDPTPGKTGDSHGTSVAGIAASAADGTCGVGAAYRASIAGLRMYVTGDNGQFSTSDANKAVVISHRNDAIAIYNNSWGPSVEFDSPGSASRSALDQAIAGGRGGRGSIIVFSAGNGLEDGSNVNMNGWANRRGIIAVGAVGHQGRQASYSEPGTAMLVTAPSSGNGRGTTTTAYRAGGSDCTDSFGGTSSAAPLASGVIALLLEARPDLTWRDVQHVLVETAVPAEPGDAGWQRNGAGYRVNPKFGLGRVDAGGATSLAAAWQLVPAATSLLAGGSGTASALPDNVATPTELSVTLGNSLELEHVQVTVNSDHPDWGDLRLTLVSPSGTRSALLVPSPANGNPGSWTFLTNFHWGEPSGGTWRLEASDETATNTGRITGWSLRAWGTSAGARANRRPVANDDAVTADTSPVVIDPLANDTDPDGDRLQLAGFERPALGALRLRSDGRLEYTRRAGEVGSTSFAYTVTDGRGRAAVGRVTVTDPRPTLLDASAVVTLGRTVEFDPFGTASVPAPDSIASRTVGAATRGTTTRLAGNLVRYVAPSSGTQPDAFPIFVQTAAGRTAAAQARVLLTTSDDFSGVFRGDGTHVRQPGGGSLNVRGAFTVEGWILPRTYGSFSTGFGRVFDKDAIILYLCAAGHALYDAESLLVAIDHPSGSSFHGTPPNSIRLGVWTHVAVTYDGASSVRMFLDGVEVTTRRYTESGGIAPASGLLDHASQPLHVGDRTAGDRSFDGLLDEVRFWNVARTPSAILAARDTRLAGGSTGLVGRWSFDEGVGTPANTGSAGGTVTVSGRLAYSLSRAATDAGIQAVADTVDVVAGEAVFVDVLANDTESRGSRLRVSSVAAPAGGSLPALVVAMPDGVAVRVPTGLTQAFSADVTIRNDLGSTSTASLVVRPHASPFARWLATAGAGLMPAGSGAGDDADGDGIPNGVEIVSGTNPLARDAARPIAVTQASPGAFALAWTRAPGVSASAIGVETWDAAARRWRALAPGESGTPTVVQEGVTLRETLPVTPAPGAPAALYRLVAR